MTLNFKNLILCHPVTPQGLQLQGMTFDRSSFKEKYVEDNWIDRSLTKELQNPCDYFWTVTVKNFLIVIQKFITTWTDDAPRPRTCQKVLWHLLYPGKITITRSCNWKCEKTCSKKVLNWKWCNCNKFTYLVVDYTIARHVKEKTIKLLFIQTATLREPLTPSWRLEALRRGLTRGIIRI